MLGLVHALVGMDDVGVFLSWGLHWPTAAIASVRKPGTRAWARMREHTGLPVQERIEGSL